MENDDIIDKGKIVPPNSPIQKFSPLARIRRPSTESEIFKSSFRDLKTKRLSKDYKGMLRTPTPKEFLTIRMNKIDQVITPLIDAEDGKVELTFPKSKSIFDSLSHIESLHHRKSNKEMVLNQYININKVEIKTNLSKNETVRSIPDSESVEELNLDHRVNRGGWFTNLFFCC